MRRVDQVASIVLLLFSVLYLTEAGKYPIWKATTLGSGFFPLILGTALLGVTALSLLRATFAVRASTSAGVLVPAKAGLMNLAVALAGVVAYVLLLEPLGFLISTFLFLSFTFYALEPDKKVTPFVLAAIVVGCSYLFFVVALKMQVPRGLLG